MSTLLIKKGSHKPDVTPTTLAVVWALCSLKIFFWSELYWWALKERNSCCLQIDRILCFFVKLSTLLIKMGSHKPDTTLTTLGVVWPLWSLKIFFWCELYWLALKEWNSCCLQIDRIYIYIYICTHCVVEHRFYKRMFLSIACSFAPLLLKASSISKIDLCHGCLPGNLMYLRTSIYKNTFMVLLMIIFVPSPSFLPYIAMILKWFII